MSQFTDLKVGTSIKHKRDQYHNCWIIAVLNNGEYLVNTGINHFTVAPKDIVEVGLTLEHALDIQEQQLAEWLRILKPEVWRELRDAAKASNIGQLNPDKIVRGTDLDSWIANYKLGNNYRPF